MLPKNRKPKSDAVASCSQFLDREIELIHPKILVSLGYYATRYLFEKYRIPLLPKQEFREVYGNLVGADLNEKGIIELFDTYEKRKILLTPINGSGFILGRGSQQFTSEVIKRVGRENIMVAGTRDKVNRLECLKADTGDFEVDKLLSGYLQVTVGYKEEMMVDVRF